VSAARRARGMTQEELARATSVSSSMLRKVEQGSRDPGENVLSALAAGLGVDVGRLLGGGGTTVARVHEALPVLRGVIDAYDVPEDGPVRPIEGLRAAVKEATGWRLSAQYTRLAESIPVVLAELIRAVHFWDGARRAEAALLLVSAYRSADGVAYKFGYYDLSARLIELMRHTADEHGDGLLAASTAYVRTETFFASGNLRSGLRALHAAVGATPARDDERGRAVLGALHMRAAVVAGRLGDGETARVHIQDAYRLGRDLREGVYFGTAFGPASVRIHEMAVAVELGDAAGAVRAAQGWIPPADLPAERRSHFYLDLARAQLWIGRREDALASLQAARSIAPQHVREHPQARHTLEELLLLYRRPPATLVTFAEWAKAV
jgi:transcriptional regulator with XRE-family HTH domain